MSIICEDPYVLTLKEEYLNKFCSTCCRSTTNRCSKCETIVYCNDQCQRFDSIYHQRECQYYFQQRMTTNGNENSLNSTDLVIVRMIIRLIIRLKVDNGKSEEDLCSNLSSNIPRRSWKDLLSHRDEILQSDRHKNLWFQTKNDFQRNFPDEFSSIDLLEIFGKILINRFRLGIHRNIHQGRIAIGWAIYLTISGLNHSCQPDLYQCSFNRQIRLKSSKEIPIETKEFYRLTLSYRHQNDFHPFNSISYVPRRHQRRSFLHFFFFNCHCFYCQDEQRNQFEEYLSLHQCHFCQENLLLKPFESNQWILICFNQKCSSALKYQIQRRIQLEIEPNPTNSIEIDEKNFRQFEENFHRNSFILIQIKENLLYQYSSKKNFQSIERQIHLCEDLIEFYDSHFSSSTIYPKLILQYLSRLYHLTKQDEKAQQTWKKAKQLWINDYQHHINIDDQYPTDDFQF